ncbi:hypothetical protein [Micromonospora sp. NPDC085948]|uniref:hypothetical protein n=1 Tax=Micromonospora sp. NPDC085948 TaxID=3155293 RepID=UPI00343686F7
MWRNLIIFISRMIRRRRGLSASQASDAADRLAAHQRLLDQAQRRSAAHRYDDRPV